MQSSSKIVERKKDYRNIKESEELRQASTKNPNGV